MWLITSSVPMPLHSFFLPPCSLADLCLLLSVSAGVAHGRDASTPSPSSLGGRLLQKAGQLMGLGGSSSSAELGEGAHGKEKAEAAVGDSAYHPWAHYAPAGFSLTINGVAPPSESGPVLETALAGFPDLLSGEAGEREKAAEPSGLGGGGGARKRTAMELWQSTHVVCWTLVRRPGAPTAETPAQAPKDTTVRQL